MRAYSSHRIHWVAYSSWMYASRPPARGRTYRRQVSTKAVIHKNSEVPSPQGGSFNDRAGKGLAKGKTHAAERLTVEIHTWDYPEEGNHNTWRHLVPHRADQRACTQVLDINSAGGTQGSD